MTIAPLHIRLQTVAGRNLLRLPRPALVALSGGRRVERDGCILDEQIQFMLFAAAIVNRAESNLERIDVARAEMAHDTQTFALPPVEMAKVTDERVREGVTARVYRPYGFGARSPALVYLHGGGFVLGNLETHDTLCRTLARDAGCVVIAIDYRLAPEHRFPAAADDATEAFRWVIREAARLDLDPARVAVGGDSAGGNLAAVVSLDTRRDAHPPALQCLVYPVVDHTRSFPSATLMAKGFLLSEASIEAFRGCYLGGPERWREPRASPWFANDLSGVAPAHVQTAGFDPLRDEGEAYAKKLRDAGVEVELRRYPSLVHGYLNFAGSIEAAREPLGDLVAALRRALGT